jgi:hypothetical protein
MVLKKTRKRIATWCTHGAQSLANKQKTFSSWAHHLSYMPIIVATSRSCVYGETTSLQHVKKHTCNIKKSKNKQNIFWGINTIAPAKNIARLVPLGARSVDPCMFMVAPVPLKTLVEKRASIPVPEGHLHRFRNRYKTSGTKGPHPLVPVPYEPVLMGPPRGRPGERTARELCYRFVLQTGTKGWLPRQEICMNLCRGREFMV